MKKNKIFSQACFVIGYPGEKKTDLNKDLIEHQNLKILILIIDFYFPTIKSFLSNAGLILKGKTNCLVFSFIIKANY